eukprot:TRINITY_DN38695_c0_g1_i1.p1 TRINITY_DN38695_c0_g1~~TRINITY_DN38695_c0_g1_i1.p1  ORF type:complete len:629 (-),score=156.83 TRINITY_DN38695_c0_g1_i1:184-2070(-)
MEGHEGVVSHGAVGGEADLFGAFSGAVDMSIIQSILDGSTTFPVTAEGSEGLDAYQQIEGLLQQANLQFLIGPQMMVDARPLPDDMFARDAALAGLSPAERVQHALKCIETYKKQLCSLLVVVEEKIDEINANLRHFMCDAMSRKRHLNPRNLLGFPPFIDVDGDQPPSNQDMDIYEELSKQVPVFHLHRPWTKDETSGLRNAAWSLNRVLQILADQAAGRQVPEYLRERTEQELAEKIEFTGFRSMAHGKLIVDWDTLAKNFVKTRTGDECRVRWFCHDDPRINKAEEWPAEETNKLLELVASNQARNWIAIAQQLGTNRTPMQCIQRYQRSHNPSIIKQEFTKAEDNRLVTLVKQHGFNWERISLAMPGRTASQCNHRYNNSAIQNIKSGRWGPEEDARLVLAKKSFDKWTQICDFVPGRTGMKCRERFANVLDPDSTISKNRPWTPEEDNLLFELVRTYGAGNWSKVSEGMEDRSDNQCYRRWRACAAKRSPEEYAEYKRRISLKKKLVLNNFVGRKKNRPSIDVSALKDVVSPPCTEASSTSCASNPTTEASTTTGASNLTTEAAESNAEQNGEEVEGGEPRKFSRKRKRTNYTSRKKTACLVKRQRTSRNSRKEQQCGSESDD